MNIYISLLKGINVGGNKLIKMDDLKKIFDSLGYKNIKTYLQSGNVIFSSNEKNTQKIADSIEVAIEKKYGFSVSVLILSVNELEEVIHNNRFQKNVDDITKLYVTYLRTTAPDDYDEKLKLLVTQEEEYNVDNKVIYLHCPNGYGLTKLSNPEIERKLKVTATTRNWKTTTELLRIAKEK